MTASMRRESKRVSSRQLLFESFQRLLSRGEFHGISDIHVTAPYAEPGEGNVEMHSRPVCNQP